MARNIASSLADKTPPCQLASFQLDLETVFRKQQHHIGTENQARVDRIQAKMNQVLRAKKDHVTVQEMNKVYDQVYYFLTNEDFFIALKGLQLQYHVKAMLLIAGCVLSLHGWPH